MRIAVLDYGCGNLRSVSKAVETAAEGMADVFVSGDPSLIRTADRVVFPGQGAMPDCMRHLQECGLETAVREALATKPVLAICIGLQMLSNVPTKVTRRGSASTRARCFAFPSVR